MHLPTYIHTLGDDLRRRHGTRVHKLSLHAGFTCPNRDGSQGHGGCTFCNNDSFSPNARKAPDISEQISSGKRHLQQRGVRKYLAYFQAYTNTYGEVAELDRLYRQALTQADVVGLSVGTRPDCVPDAVLDLLCRYRDEGFDVWLELGLQSAFDQTLARVNRGHGFRAYADAISRCHARGLRVCTHLIMGLPGEQPEHSLITLEQVLTLGVAGLKLHPLHVVKNSLLASDWKRGRYQPISEEDYIQVASEMIRRTPRDVIFHRLTATAQNDLLLAPHWCAQKWPVMNGIVENLKQYGAQGSHSQIPLADLPLPPPPAEIGTEQPRWLQKLRGAMNLVRETA